MSDSLRHSQRQRAKLILRRIAIRMCSGLLRMGSRPLQLKETPMVIIAPHQDDESLACGGLIARKRNEGLPVHVIFITDGSASHPHHPRVTPHELAQLRRREAMRAMARLGVERPCVHFLDEPDGTLNVIPTQRRSDLIWRLIDLLGRIKPGEVFLPCHPDGSSEHDAAFEFVAEAIQRLGFAPEVWQYPVWTWWNPGLMLRRWIETRDCCRLPLEDYQQAKEQAVLCYLSQIAPLPPDTTPALPAELVEIFLEDCEFFFRYEPAAPAS